MVKLERMKNKFLFSCIAGLIGLAAVGTSNLANSANSPQKLNVTSEQIAQETTAQNNQNPDFSALEKAIFQETNRARVNPALYAELIEKQRSYYENNILKVPGKTPIRTKEGLIAVDEAIAFLRKTKPLAELKFSKGMSKASQEQATCLQDKNLSHDGCDGSKINQRLNRYGTFSVTAGENIAAGSHTAQDVVMQLIIDDGVFDRGHRENIYESKFKVTGVSCNSHIKYKTICVINYAGGYKEK